MPLMSISKGKQSNDFNAPGAIKILLELFLVFLYIYDLKKGDFKVKSFVKIFCVLYFVCLFTIVQKKYNTYYTESSKFPTPCH